MADRPERPERPETTTTRRPTNSNARSNTTTTRSSRPRATTTTLYTTLTSTLTSPSGSLLPSTSSLPDANAGGLSGGAIGGIVGGVALLFGLVGFLCFKRKKRAAIANAANARKAPNIQADGPISGPMALAPEQGVADTMPAHRPEAQFRQQQQFRPGMRDELFAAPGARNNSNSNNNGNSSGTKDNVPSQGHHRQPSNNAAPPYQEALRPPNGTGHLDQEKQGGYYDDPLVHDYYGDEKRAPTPETHVGAMRPTPAQMRDMSQGNLTPAPDYYLGKEDADPRRDVRGLNNPDSFNAQTNPTNIASQQSQQRPPINTQEADSPRSSCSSDNESVYQTLEEAQRAHNLKMMGHKQSIGSVDILLENNRAANAAASTTNHGPGYAAYSPGGYSAYGLTSPNGRAPSPDISIYGRDAHMSLAPTESTMSMMPSLPPTASPMTFRNADNHGYVNRGPGSGPVSPMTPLGRNDLYAESAYSSDDFSDDRSIGYYGGRPQPSPGGQGYGYGNRGGAPPPGPYGPYNGQGLRSPPQRPYPNGPGGGGYGPMSPPYNSTRPQQPPRGGPGFGPTHYGPNGHVPQGRPLPPF